MGLKETFANLDKKNAVIVSLLALLTISSTANTVGTYQVKNLLSNGGDISAPKNDRPSGGSAKKPSDYKFGTKYEKAVKSKKPMIVLFYADWCGFCIRFMPIYEKLYKAHKNQFNFVKINVEDEKYRDEVEKYEISAFPTVFMVNTQEDTHEQLMNEDFGDMKKLNSILNKFYKENK